MAEPTVDGRFYGQPLLTMETVLLADWWVALSGMAAPTPQSILDRAACFDCLPDHQLQVIQAVLMADILAQLDGAADVTPQGILSRGACFACLPGSDLEVVRTVATAEAAAAA